ncbi:MAG: glycosyltransferase, partial [Candidatus Symbiothrix sp.]|nr:glycosyltransferase [Candidatus Symbiothrix sp.]
KINPLDFCVDPYRKSLSGGSDCHIGLFAGMTGTDLHIPHLNERLKTESHSQLALEAIRNGAMAPFGSYQNTQKMTIALLHYACQIALNYKDPGLVRLLLHKGSANDKIISMLASNLFLEVQKHKVTGSFIKTFLDSLDGENPRQIKKLILKPVYRPIFNEAVHIAQKKKDNKADLVNGYYDSIVKINDLFSSILAKRIEKKLRKSKIGKQIQGTSLESFIEKLELPTYIRKYAESDKKGKKGAFNISEFLDGLSFPFFGSMFILSAHFASAKTMFHTRPFLNDFSKRLGCFEHPRRALWLSDTFGDKNGVSIVLKEMHEEIKKKNLPSDIVACSSTLKPDDHLIVLKPIKEFSLPIYTDYDFRIPNFLELHNLFSNGDYDRVICSTEGVMGLCGLYLKHACSVEASFYLHTDWLMFARKSLHIEGHNLNRVRRLLRSFYQSFDHVFVLNSDQKSWLSGMQMNIRAEKVHQTAHWVNECFKPCEPDKENLFGLTANEPVLLYVGRISPEKGVLELPSIYKGVKQKYENARIVIVGKGLALDELRKEIPDGIFMDWVVQSRLPEIYSSADILVLPSKFDTFSNAVLEALSCGLPAVAYKTKGPKDIIKHEKNGFLVDTKQEIHERIIEYLDSTSKKSFQTSALKRAKDYNADAILSDFINTIGLSNAK